MSAGVYVKNNKVKFDIKKLYLYSATLIGLIIIVIGAFQLINLAFKAYIFKDSDRYQIAAPLYEPMTGKVYPEAQYNKMLEEQQRNQDLEVLRSRKRQASTGIALLITGIPLYLYHWKLVNKKES
jgi:hypothetical protein